MKTLKEYNKNLKDLYERDYYLWIEKQIEYLERREFEKLDIENLIEELRDMGKSEIRAVASYFGILFSHLYKWEHFPEKRTRSWANSIYYSRDKILELLSEQPSLNSKIDQIIKKGWSYAQKIIIDDTEIEYQSLPKESPYTYDYAMNHKIEL